MNTTLIAKKILPGFIAQKFVGSKELQKVATNIFWLFIDKIFRMGVGLVVGVWVARYLGPEQFGIWNYAGAFVALFAAFASFGLDSIVVRDIVNTPGKAGALLGSAFILRLAGGLGVVILASGAVLFIRPGNYTMFILVLISAGGTLFQAFDIIDLHFQADVLSKYTVWAKNAAFIVVTIIKIFFLFAKLSLYAFALVGMFEIMLGAGFMIVLYQYNNRNVLLWKPDISNAKKLLMESWPLILSTLASVINMRIGQVMLGKLMNDTEVGNYSAATKISEIWLMVPAAVSTSIFPSIIAAKDKGQEIYRRRILRVFGYMCCWVIPLAFVISLSSNGIITLLYGSQYSSAGNILSIHIWSGVPYLTTFVFSQMFYIERLVKLSFYTSLLVPILSVISNLVFIPEFGGIGAAYSALVTAVVCLVVSMVVLNFYTGIFFGKGRLR